MLTSVPEDRFGYQLKRAQHALRLAMDAELARHGLSAPQYAVLSVLHETREISGAELARRCFVTPQTANGLLVRLAQRRLIERQAHPSHGRIITASLTDAGREAVALGDRVAAAAERRMLGALPAARARRLATDLQACADALVRSR